MTLKTLLSFLAPLILSAEEPWSGSAVNPSFDAPKPAIRPQPASTGQATAFLWLAFYRNWLPVLVQSNCRMDPSCSTYALLAIEKHGAAIGIVMTADRLLHEGDEQGLRRVVRSMGKAYCPDPVSNNDFWWNAP